MFLHKQKTGFLTSRRNFKEAEEYILAGSKFDPDATTRGQQKQKEEEAEEKAAAAKKPKIAKGVTMAATAKVNWVQSNLS